MWHARGDDDYFSSDLDDAQVAANWGQFGSPVLVLHSGEDEFVPKTLDVAALVKRWSGYFRAPGAISGLSATIPGASHNVRQPQAREWVADRVSRFLQSEVGAVGGPRI